MMTHVTVENKSAGIEPLTERKAWKALEDHARKIGQLHLRALFAALYDLRVDLHRIAGAKIGDGFFELVAVDDVDDVHSNFLTLLAGRNEEPGAGPGITLVSYHAPSSGCNRSARRAAVRRRDCSRRHRAILAWSPERSTSGTSTPRKFAGRVYEG